MHARLNSSSAGSFALFALVAIPLLALFAYLGGSELWRGARQVLVFQHTQGTVIGYRAPEPLGKRDVAAGRLDFDFKVGGIQHSAVYAPQHSTELGRLSCPVLAKAWRPGDTVTVYYDPADPAECTLEPRIEPLPLVLLTFLAPVALFVASGFVRGRQSIALQEVDDGSQLAGGTIFFPVYFLLSLAATLSLAVVFRYLDWRVDLAIGILVPTVVIPLAMLILVRWQAGTTLMGRRKKNRVVESPPPSRIVMAVVGSVWWLFVGFALWQSTLAPLLRAWPALSSYKVATGTIVASEMIQDEPSSSSDGVTYHAAVKYAYDVDGKNYRSSRLSFAAPMSAPSVNVQPMVDRYPVGAQVTVHYDPADPSQAVIDLDVWRHQVYFNFFIFPFVLVGFVLLLTAIRPSATNWMSQSARVSRAVLWFMCTHIGASALLMLVGAIDPGRAWLVGFGVVADVVAVTLALVLKPARPAGTSRTLRRHPAGEAG